jgi:hypothetical protein
MARAKSPGSDTPKKQGRIAQVRAVFAMTRKADPAVVPLMVLAAVATLLLGYLVGFLFDAPVYFLVVAVPLALLAALVVMARRAERAAYAQLTGQPGATGAALGNLRRGWNVESEPVAVDPRTHDLVFRAVGRPGVVLVTEGPLPRVNRLAEQERKRVSRVLGPNVPVLVLNAGDEDGQIPLRKLQRTLVRKKPALTKTEVSEVAKRLRALGGVRLPIPKGVDPGRMRPDRRATRGR